MLGGASLIARPSAAAALAAADQGLNACGSNTGKALYDCVGNVLDKLGNDIEPAGAAQTARSLHAAAAGVRSGVKAQALSAIALCRSAVASALRQVNASAARFVEGLGGSGLNAISGVLAHAARLIQTKG